MGVSKVVLNSGETLIDLTGDTVTPQVLLNGFTAHGGNGELINGLLNPSYLEYNTFDILTDTGTHTIPLTQQFTPTGYVLLRVNDTESGAIATYDTGEATRIIAYLRIGDTYYATFSASAAYSFRCRRGTPTTPIATGEIYYTTSAATYHFSVGHWMYVAWAV